MRDSPLSDDEFLMFRPGYTQEEIEEDDDRNEYFVNLLFKHFLERETEKEMLIMAINYMLNSMIQYCYLNMKKC